MTIVGFADKVLTGGGKRPSLLVWWFLGAWFVNSIVFCFAAERMAPNSVPLLLNTDLRNNCAAKPNVGWVRCELGAMKEFPKFYPLLYAADVLVPIMDLQQSRYWQPISGEWDRGTFAFFYRCFSGAFGWLLGVALVTVATRWAKGEDGNR